METRADIFHPYQIAVNYYIVQYPEVLQLQEV